MIGIQYDSTFFKKSNLAPAILNMFEELPGYLCFIKDSDRRLVAINDRLAELISVEDKAAIIGMNDFDYLPMHLAEVYEQDDFAVLEGATVSNKVELVSRSKGLVDWSNTT